MEMYRIYKNYTNFWYLRIQEMTLVKYFPCIHIFIDISIISLLIICFPTTLISQILVMIDIERLMNLLRVQDTRIEISCLNTSATSFRVWSWSSRISGDTVFIIWNNLYLWPNSDYHFLISKQRTSSFNTRALILNIFKYLLIDS